MMNFGDIEPLQAHNHGRYQQNYDLPVTPLNARLAADYDYSPSVTSSISDPATVIRWHTPPQSPQRSPKLPTVPQPAFQTPNPTPERSFETIRPANYAHARRIGANEPAYASNTPLVRFDEEQIRINKAEAETWEREQRMDQINSNPPTPVDDTPYIRFAIDQLTRDEDIRALQRPATAASSDSYPVNRIVPDYGLGYMTPERQREAMALTRKHRSSPDGGRLFTFNPTRPLSYNSDDVGLPSAPSPPPMMINQNTFIPVDPPRNSLRHPDLTFVPTILRPASMITLSSLCLAMIALLMFCAIFSSYHNGLLQWYGGIYGSRYFLFSFFPQILAGFIFMCIQAVMSTITRIMPFTTMAFDDAHDRTNALFMRMFPQTMLWPRWSGCVSVHIANSCLWLSIFTIPLQSCLFSVKMVHGIWRWRIVQGVAWTLVALYLLILVGTVVAALFFSRRRTGLMWDPRSLADIIALLPRSNSLKGFPGTEIMRAKEDIRIKLGLRSDRLGYWRTPSHTQGVFYCIGEEGASTRQYTLEAGRLHEKLTDFTFGQFADVEKAGELYARTTRYRYIPWYLRDTFAILWAVAGLIFLLALFIVSFLPSTAIRKSFPPLVPVVPNSAGYSPANFLYSFIPSLFGLLLYLAFQPLDMALRVLTPYAELARPEGASAAQSLLLDYPACGPLSCTIKAISARHYRVALFSFLSLILLLLPILAGGLFFPLTTPSGSVSMIPNLAAFYSILALLILYLIALLCLLPRRYAMHLPHGATCLAELVSWVYNSEILGDAAFSAPRSHADLEGRLNAVGTGGGRKRFLFGVGRGRDGREWMGIERVGRRMGGGVLAGVR